MKGHWPENQVGVNCSLSLAMLTLRSYNYTLLCKTKFSAQRSVCCSSHAICKPVILVHMHVHAVILVLCALASRYYLMHMHVHAGTTCVSLTPPTPTPLSTRKRKSTGCLWTCTWVEQSMRCCTCCTRASGTRCVLQSEYDRCARSNDVNWWI